MRAKWARPAVALLHGLAVAGDLRALGRRVSLAAPHGAPRRQPRGAGARQHRHVGPPTGVAEPAAPPGAGAEEAAPCAPVAAGLDAHRPPKVALRDNLPEHVLEQPQRVPLRGLGGGGPGERVARCVRLAPQRAFDAADPHQLGGFLPPDPLLLRLLGIDDDDHRLLRPRGWFCRRLVRHRRHCRSVQLRLIRSGTHFDPINEVGPAGRQAPPTRGSGFHGAAASRRACESCAVLLSLGSVVSLRSR
jgi:hypothetical protein